MHPVLGGYAFGFDPTSRCHKREFLLKSAKDRHRWMQWLFEAKKRYKLVTLNYVVTSNHVHLLVYDKDDGGTIPKSIQLLAGRTGQEYNQRKKRNGSTNLKAKN
jgi:putative transposase